VGHFSTTVKPERGRGEVRNALLHLFTTALSILFLVAVFV
jgi:hypothetical protein